MDDRTIYFEQYKLAVEMADRISARRVQTNSFYIGIHLALLTAIAAMIEKNLLLPNLLGFIPITAGAVLALSWRTLITSYRNLNTQKYNIIGEMEQNLPFQVFAEEWRRLGSGTKVALYWPLSHIERHVPIIIFFLHIGLLAYLIAHSHWPSELITYLKNEMTSISGGNGNPP